MDFEYERKLDANMVAGIDEAGRGPLAGPVVAAAVIFPSLAAAKDLRSMIDDSKKLSPVKREAAYERLLASDCIIGVGSANVEEIEKYNILNASFMAFTRAVDDLKVMPDHALIDGNRLPKSFPCRCTSLIKGDAKSMSIAAASIIAKVTRDRIMCRMAEEYPGYGFERHMGYGTKAHYAAIKDLGITPIHRRSFIVKE